MWQCTDKPCLATCAVYGDGHYITFDGQRYSFSGNCGYTLLQVCLRDSLARGHPQPQVLTQVPSLSPNGLLLLQDHCDGNGSVQDAFRVVTENIPCGTTGTTCSKDIKIFLGVSGMEAAEHPGAPQWGRGTPEGVWSWLAPETPCHTEL